MAASSSRPSASRSIRQALADRGINLEDVRAVLGEANVDLPKGTLNSPRQTFTLNTNDQLFKPDQYADLVIAYRNGSPVRIRDIGRAISAGENELIAAWFDQKRGIFWPVQRQPGANVIATVDRVKAMLPQLQASIPKDIKVFDPVRPHPDHPRFNQRGAFHADAHGRVGGNGDLPVLAERLGHGDTRRHRAAVADRNFRGDL